MRPLVPEVPLEPLSVVEVLPRVEPVLEPEPELPEPLDCANAGPVPRRTAIADAINARRAKVKELDVECFIAPALYPARTLPPSEPDRIALPARLLRGDSANPWPGAAAAAIRSPGRLGSKALACSGKPPFSGGAAEIIRRRGDEEG